VEALPESSHPFSKLLELRATLVDAGSASDGELDDEVEALVVASHARFVVNRAGTIVDSETERAIGVMTRGADLLHPEVRVTLEELGSGARSRIQRRLVAWTRDAVSELLASLRKPALGELSPAARGLIYQLEQQLGSVLSRDAHPQLEALSDADRQRLSAAGVELGRRVVFVRPLLKAPALALRAALVAARSGSRMSGAARGAVSFRVPRDADKLAHLALGYPVFGPRAVRSDVAERVAAAFLNGGEAPDVRRVSSWLGSPQSDVPRVLAALGVAAEARPASRPACPDPTAARASSTRR
jgi:ATP-dependent RNA helicase SUPV3L1/SUV3